MDEASALNRAELDILQQYGHQTAPYYWAAFEIIGEGKGKITFPNGMLIPKAAFYTWEGKSYEGRGVTPDFPIPWSPRAVREGGDNQLEKAVEDVNSL